MPRIKTSQQILLANRTVTVTELDIDYERTECELSQVLASVWCGNVEVSLLFQGCDPIKLAPQEAGNDDENDKLVGALITNPGVIQEIMDDGYRDFFEPLTAWVREQFELYVERENAALDESTERDVDFEMAFECGYNSRFCRVHDGFLDVMQNGTEQAHLPIDEQLRERLEAIEEQFGAHDVQRTYAVLKMVDEALEPVSTWGGAGRGQGRKTLDEDSPTVRVSVTMTEVERETFKALGGSAWLRQQIAAAK